MMSTSKAVEITNWRDLDKLDGQLDGQFNGVPVARLKAVLAVESSGDGFLSDGRPKILFEGHQFWKHLQKCGIDPRQERPGNEDILYPRWTKKHYQGGSGEHDRLHRACLINEDSALMSTSWGLGQVMGFNHKTCGYDDVHSFVEAMKSGVDAQVRAFLAYIENSGLWEYLQGDEANYEAFARGYNGPGWKKNNYAAKLRRAERLYTQDPAEDFPKKRDSRTNWGAVIAGSGGVTKGASKLLTPTPAETLEQSAEGVATIADTAEQAGKLIDTTTNTATAVQHIWQDVGALSTLGWVLLACGVGLVLYARWDDRRNGYR